MTTRISKLRGRLTYGNVTATLALFIALGGTGYAAITLPRNSVGSTQIRSNAVRSSDIRPKTIRLSDIASRTRNSLRGAQGPAGPPAVSEHARVDSGGGTVGTALRASHTGATNVYTVEFGRDVSNCTYTASLGTVPGGLIVDPPAGSATVAAGGGPNVTVKTFDAAGNPAESPFHLIVAC